MDRFHVRIETPDQEVVEILQAKTPQERLNIAFGMWRAARDMLISLLASGHPDWDQDRIMEEVARRLSHGSV